MMFCKVHTDTENIIRNARDCVACDNDLQDAMRTARECGDNGSLIKNKDGYYEYVKGPPVSSEEINKRVNAYFYPLFKMAQEVEDAREKLYGHHRADNTPQ